MSSAVIETGLSSEASNIHRALASLQEELESHRTSTTSVWMSRMTRA